MAETLLLDLPDPGARAAPSCGCPAGHRGEGAMAGRQPGPGSECVAGAAMRDDPDASSVAQKCNTARRRRGSGGHAFGPPLSTHPRERQEADDIASIPLHLSLNIPGDAAKPRGGRAPDWRPHSSPRPSRAARPPRRLTSEAAREGSSSMIRRRSGAVIEDQAPISESVR